MGLTKRSLPGKEVGPLESIDGVKWQSTDKEFAQSLPLVISYLKNLSHCLSDASVRNLSLIRSGLEQFNHLESSFQLLNILTPINLEGIPQITGKSTSSGDIIT